MAVKEIVSHLQKDNKFPDTAKLIEALWNARVYEPQVGDHVKHDMFGHSDLTVIALHEGMAWVRDRNACSRLVSARELRKAED